MDRRIAMRGEKKEINIRIGKRLKEARESNGFTQEKLAEVLNVGVEHYRKVESGMYGLQLEKMLLLYEKYKIDPTYLITGNRKKFFDLEEYLANCSRDERNKLIERILDYMKKMLIEPQ